MSFSFHSRYSIVLMYYAFSLLLTIILRPAVSHKLCRNSGTPSFYAALYFLPVLTVCQAVFGGLLCKQYSVLTHNRWKMKWCNMFWLSEAGVTWYVVCNSLIAWFLQVRLRRKHFFCFLARFSFLAAWKLGWGGGGRGFLFFHSCPNFHGAKLENLGKTNGKACCTGCF